LYEMDKVTLPLFAAPSETEKPPAIVCRSNEKKAPAEWQANQFAARLLMPGGHVRRAAQALWGGVGPTEDVKGLATDVIRRGGFTNVSNEAMRIRLGELKLLPAAGAVLI